MNISKPQSQNSILVTPIEILHKITRGTKGRLGCDCSVLFVHITLSTLCIHLQVNSADVHIGYSLRVCRLELLGFFEFGGLFTEKLNTKKWNYFMNCQNG